MNQTKDDELQILKEFKQRTSDLKLPEHEDRYLLRWLRARSFNIEKSEQMLRKHIEWRKAWSVDSLTDDWEPPEVLKKYRPMEFIGFDIAGRPVWFGRHAQFDIRGAMMSVNSRELLRYFIWQIERSRRLMQRQSQRLGRDILTHIIVSDMENYKIKYMTYRPGHEVGLKFAQMYEANYPEMLEQIIILNTVPIFHVLFKIVRPFLSEQTLSKMHFYGSNRAEWEAALKEIIPDDVLPKKWGGKRVDSHGDETCREIIGEVGDIPPDYYLSNQQEDFTGCPTVRIMSGRKLIIKKTAFDPNSIIRWKFRSQGGDIGFGIRKEKSSDESEEVLAKTRIMAHEYAEEGQIVVDTGEYSIEFDNSYSYFTAKHVTFSVEVDTLETERQGNECALRTVD